MLASFGWSDLAYLALAVFLFAAGRALRYAAIRLGGTLGRASSLLEGAETELLPVISKLGGTVDRVNVQLDKVDLMTDSAVDAVAGRRHGRPDRERRRHASRSRSSPAWRPGSGTGCRRCGRAVQLAGRGSADGQGGGRSAGARSRGGARRTGEEMSDEIVLTLPRERRFYDVAHLVVSGLGARLNLTMDNLADLQLALDGLLPRRETGGRDHGRAADRRRAARRADRPVRRRGAWRSSSAIGGDGYGTPVVLESGLRQLPRGRRRRRSVGALHEDDHAAAAGEAGA